MTLLEIYKEFAPALESAILAFERRSRDMLEKFKETTTDIEDMKKLSMIEVQIGMRTDDVRKLGKGILMNIENASLALHSPDITDWISEEVKKNSAGKASQKTSA